MADQVREERFEQSLRDWGYVFMLTIWIHSIMTSAVAKKTANTEPKDLFEHEMAATWEEFKNKFPGSITTEEECTASMIILIRNQLAHCLITSRKEHALFLPKPRSKRLLNKLKNAGWVEMPAAGALASEMLIMREGDTEWFARNTAMIWNFSENTIFRLTRAHGIDDSAIC